MISHITWFFSSSGDEEKSGNGVSKDSEVTGLKALFVINADVADNIFDAFRRGYAIARTGVIHLFRKKIDHGKKIIVLQGSREQVQEAMPILLERIREFQDYEVIENETVHVESFLVELFALCKKPWLNFEDLFEL